MRPPEFDPGACLEASVQAAPVDPLDLLPLYPRLPEAVSDERFVKVKAHTLEVFRREMKA